MSEGPSEPHAETEALVASLQGSLDALIVCISHSWGGLEQVAVNDSLDLASLGLKVRVLCLEGTPVHEKLAHKAGVRAIPLSFRPRDYFDFKLRNELFRLIDDGVNLVHTHQPSLLGSIAPWLWAKPQVALLASRHIMSGHDKRNFFHRMIYQRLDWLVVMSQALRKNVLQTHPLREPQVRVVHLGLDFGRFDPEKVDRAERRRAWGLGDETLVVGLVGRIDPMKGQATLIRAAANLLQGERPLSHVKFVIVGEETLGRSAGHLAELRELVTQFGIQDSVIFTGYEEDIPEIMRALDIFVMPSRQEAFGLVAIEAMAMGCPVVLSSGGSSDEIIGEQEEFGLRVRPDDAFDLQRQLRFLIDHPKERHALSERAMGYVRRSFDGKLRIQRTLELYDRAVRRRSRF